MYKLIRFFNQNRKKIIRTMLFIVLIILIINLLNNNIKNKNENNYVETVTTDNTFDEVISNKSAVSGESISNSKLKKDTDIIKEFVGYCNEQDINSAYSILTDECKEEMFPTIEDFNNIYYEKLFNGNKKQYTIENWNGNIYQVRITEDILASGKINDSSTKQDYITVVNKNGEKKLNINNYVGRKNADKTTEMKDIKMTITSIDTYMDYEIYNLTIENNSDNTILLDVGGNPKSVYLLDSKQMKYYFYGNEIVENKLMIESKFKNTIKIKFNNSYSSSREIEKLVFSKLVLNYEEYKNIENKEEYDFYKFNVNV